MKSWILIPALILLVLLLVIPFIMVLSLTDDPDDDEFFQETGFFMGTAVKIKLYGEKDSALLDEVFNEISRLEGLMSLNMKDSQVSIINRAAGRTSVPVDPRVFEVVSRGLYYSRLSEGLFDITIGPLVELWGIGHENARVPESIEIEESLPLVDYTHIIMDPEESLIYLDTPGMVLDLGGIAKGYIADRIVLLLNKAGRESGIINLGGNVFAMGQKPEGGPFRIGVQNPDTDRGEYIGVLSVRNKSIVSSGAYERYLEYEGERYHHILNPFTGYPAESDLDQVTIVSDESVDGDGLSTSVFSMGLEAGMKLIESVEGVEAVFLTSSDQVYLSGGIDNQFELTNRNFELMQFD